MCKQSESFHGLCPRTASESGYRAEKSLFFLLPVLKNVCEAFITTNIWPVKLYRRISFSFHCGKITRDIFWSILIRELTEGVRAMEKFSSRRENECFANVSAFLRKQTALDVDSFWFSFHFLSLLRHTNYINESKTINSIYSTPYQLFHKLQYFLIDIFITDKDSTSICYQFQFSFPLRCEELRSNSQNANSHSR